MEVEERRLVAARAATRVAELQARRYALLAEIGRAALGGATALDLFGVAVAQIPEVLDCDAVVVLEIDQGTGALVVCAGTEPVCIPAGTEAFEFQPVLADGPAIWTDSDDAAGTALDWARPVGAALGALIRGPQRNFGVVAVYRWEPEPFHEDDVLWVRSVANVLGAAVAREQTEQELRAREVQTRLALAAGRMGAWRWDPETDEVWWSPELEHVYGFPPGSFSGTFAAYAAAIHPQDRARVAAIVEPARAGGDDFTVEHRVVRPADGEVRWIEVRGSPLRGRTGEIEQWIGIAIDITERVAREEVQRQREIQTHFAFSAGRMGSWTWNPELGKGTISVELEALLGMPPGSYDGTWAGFVAPILEEDHEVLRHEVLQAAGVGGEFTVRYRIRRTDGEIRWMESRGRRAAAGGEWVGVTIDVTEPMRVEQERQRSAALLRATYDTAPVGLAFLDRQLRVRFVNEHLARLHGRSADLHIGRHLVDVVPEIGAPIEAELGRVLADGIPRLQFEVRGVTAASPGEPRVFDASAYPVVVDGGEVIGVGLVLVDTTDRRREQRALLEAHERLGEIVARLDTLLERGPFGFAFLDPDGRVIGLNQRYAELTGVPLERHIGRRLASVAPGIAVPVGAAARAVLDGATTVDGVEITGPAQNPDGGERFWLLSHFPVRDATGAVTGVGSLAVDITEQRRRERSARLAARVGDLVHRDGDDVLQLAAEATIAEFADLCLVCVPPVGGAPRRSALAHADPRVQQALANADERRPLDVALLREALGDRDYLLVPEVSDSIRDSFHSGDETESALVELAGVRSVLLAPLRVGARDLGVVVFAQSDRSGRRFREPDAALACDLAFRMAQLVERRMLARDADRAVARLGLLAAISELLTVDLDSQARLDAIVDVVVPIFADTCSVYVPVDGGIEMGAFASVEPLARAEYLALEQPIRYESDARVPPAEVMRTGRSLLVSDCDVQDTASWDTVGARLRVAAATGSFILVPLPGCNGPIGVIGFALRGDRRYEAADLPLAEEIARRVSPAVENAWRFEREAATAGQLQQVLLPERLAHLDSVELAARYRPSAVDVRVGGDWYDAVELPGGELLVAIGDVVGHGGAAATWMGKLRSVVQFCGLDGHGPGATLRHVNEYCRLLPGADMTTVMIAVYDPLTTRLRFASAGHPPAMVRAADGAVRQVWEGRGPPLGALDHPAFDESEIELVAGELLLLYTDGLVERRGESLDVGLERLAQALGTASGPVEAIADGLLAELLDGSAAADDVALLLMRPRDAGADLTLRLRADPRELARLRRATRAWLRRARCGDERIGEVLVAVNELAANAIEHAYGPADSWFEVSGRVDSGIATFEVRDFGRWRAPRQSTHRGRGLHLVADLADDFSLDRTDTGTVARFHVRVDAP